MLNLDHFYVRVTDMDAAIDFYESLLQRRITHREDNRWADFDEDDGSIYFGILNVKVDGLDLKIGNNITLALKTDNIEREHKRISKLDVKNITRIISLDQDDPYKYFEFSDKWGNIWEVAEYNY